MRKIFYLICVAVFITICAAGCGNNDNDDAFDPAKVKRYDYVLDESSSHVQNIPYDKYLSAVSAPSDAVNASEYGLAADGDYIGNTVALQAAIDKVSADGGGTVLVSGGEYAITSVQLKSGVTLHIERGSGLKSVDYLTNLNSDRKLTYGVIWAQNAHDISITGGGYIDGNGPSFANPSSSDEPFLPMETFNLKQYVLGMRSRIRFAKSNSGRVNLVYINNCSGVNLKNIEFKETASWTVNLVDSDDIEIEKTVINNNIYVANSDGYDVVGCQNVSIKDSFIATGDDGIVIKANSAEPVENVDIENCHIMSIANCFKIGTETAQDISDVTVKDCYFFRTGVTGGYAGIAIESADGSAVSNVNVSNIVMDKLASPLLIWLGDRLGFGDKDTPGSVSGIRVSDIVAFDADMASAVTGCYRSQNKTVYNVTDVELKNFHVYYREANEDLYLSTDDENLDRIVKEQNSGGYPEISRVIHMYLGTHEGSYYLDMPCYGLYTRYAPDLKTENFNVTPRSCNTRPATVLNDGLYE